MPVAKALIAAHRRGVKVQMILNDHQYTKAMRAIREEIGAKRYRSSFIYRCTAGCRSKQNQYNNMHTKFYSFSRAGRSKDVLAVGSANMMLNADIHQWNDLYFTSGDHELFRQFVRLFNDMRKDHSTRQPPQFFCGTPANGVACDDSVDKHTVWAWPKPSGPRNDLVLDLLGKVQCLTPDGAGGQKRSRIAVSMHTMRGKRGDYLASAIRQKWIEGCKVRVMYGLIGYHTKRVVGAPTSRGRIPLRSTGLDYNPDDDYDLNKDGKDDLILSYYSHQKYVAIQGTYNGNPRHAHDRHGLGQLGEPEPWQRRALDDDPRQEADPEVRQELQLPVAQQAQLAQRLHHDVRQLPRRPDRGRRRRHDAHGLEDRPPAGHDDRAGPLPQGPLLGGRLRAAGAVHGGPENSRTNP